MPTPRLAGLRFRLSLLIAVAVLPAMALNIASTFDQREAVAAETTRHAMWFARAITADQMQAAHHVEEMLQALALVPAVRSMEPGACSAALGQILGGFPHYTSLSVFTPGGELACRGSRLGSPGRVEGLAVESAFRRALESGHFAIGEYGLGAMTGRAVVPFGLPIMDEDGAITAVLTSSLDLLAPARWAGDAGFPVGATAVVLDRTGRVLLTYPDPHRWSNVRLPESSPLLPLLARSDSGVVEADALDGLPRIFAVSRLPSPEAEAVFIAVGVPRAQAYAAANRMLAWNLLVLTVLVALTVGAGWGVGTRMLVAPVRSLIAATRRLAAGDLATRAETSPRHGELAELGQAFNEMAESLESRTAETAAWMSALRRSEERYRSLVEASAAMVWTASPAGNLQGPQPGWTEFTGQATAELVGAGWLGAVHPDDRSSVAEAWAAAVRAGEPCRLEQRLRRHDGEYRTMQVRAVPIRDDAGAVREWIGIHTDITSRHQAEQERAALLVREQEARAEAERANRAKSDFLAVVSHELRTPLTSIISYAELMAHDIDGTLCARHREYLSRVDASAWHLKEIVDQILQLTQLEAGGVEVAQQPVDVSALVRSAADSVEPLCGARCLALRTMLPAGPVVVRTDATRLRQILLNLLSNAIKFTDEGEVRVELEAHDGWARFRVRDTGVGIEAHNLSRIWETFWQAENPLTRRAGGTGLGLAITRRLTELLGGRIRVDSEVGRGTTFELSLPLAPPVVGVTALRTGRAAAPPRVSAAGSPPGARHPP